MPTRRQGIVRWAPALLLASAAWWVLALPAAASQASRLRLSGMTFVGTRADATELVVRARKAVFLPETNLAKLDHVRAYVSNGDEERSFEMTCDRADFDLETNDFTAEGNVVGRTREGERYTTPWVRYDDAEGVLSSEAPVTVTNATGTFSGDGFRYHLREQRFQLLGNVRVEQAP